MDDVGKCIVPLSREQTRQIFRHKILSKRIRRSRSAYGDPMGTRTEGKGNCARNAASLPLATEIQTCFKLTGHVQRPQEVQNTFCSVAQSPAGTRSSTTLHLWHTWMGSASTAFLQGTQEDASRPLPPYMFPPTDGLISTAVQPHCTLFAETFTIWAKRAISTCLGLHAFPEVQGC